MKNLDGKTIPLGLLLSQEFFFKVPEYQRPFSWDVDNFEDLVTDLANAAKDQEYFLGTIVLHETGGRKHYDVVDGQQRLTSVLILLACIRDRLESEEHKLGIQSKIVQARNVVDGVPERVRLEVKDRRIFNEMVVQPGGTLSATDVANLPEPEWRYARAIQEFHAKLAGLDENALQSLTEFISQRCVIIYLATTEFDDAFRLFTIVNDRGKQLRRIDVLKAINIAPSVIASDPTRSRIAQEWEVHEKGLGESVFESVFHLVRLILLKDKPQGDLLSEFEKRVFPRGLATLGEPFLDLIFQYAQLYSEIFVDRTYLPAGDPQTNRFRGLMFIMDAEFQASEWRACLLSFAKKFGPAQFYPMVLVMEKVYLGHWVAGVRKDERYAEYVRILSIIDSSRTAGEVLAQVTPDLEVIRTAARSNDLYRTGYGKYFLLRLEIVTAEHDVPHEFTAKSVEHVLPQNPQPAGYWAGVHDLEAAKDYVNSIGNLVLLSKSKNSAAQNFDFARKKTRYLSGRVSDYPRSIQVLDYPDWDRAVIEARTREAAELVVQDP